MARAWWATWMVAVAVGCAPQGGEQDQVKDPEAPRGPVAKVPSAQPADAKAPKKKVVLPPVAAENAPPASARLAPLASQKALIAKAATYFKGHAGRRLHVQVDKPLYKPGETIWIKAWDLETRTLKTTQRGSGFYFKLISPKGAEVLKKRVKDVGGRAHNDFVLPAGVPGGEYVVRVESSGVKGERKIIVSNYEAPRIKKKLEFTRKAYGVGDAVAATLALKRPTGEPLAKTVVRVQVVVDGRLLPEVRTTTNADGGAMLRFTLPAAMEKGDVLLTALVEDGGVTESISRRVPVILKKLQLSFFAEGGDLIEGLESRVYFEAKNTLGKPADVEGEIVDDQGQVVSRFKTYKNGLGRMNFTPNTGRKYTARVTRPAGVTERYSVPLAKQKGCALRTFDDLDGRDAALRVAVRCTEARTVVVAGTRRETVFDAATVTVPEGKPAVVYLKSDDPADADAMGVARITVFTDDLKPLAERLVFRNRRKGLRVKIEPNKTAYVPREQVGLTVVTTDAKGKPVQAEIALSVVDDTVISFADDKKGHLLSGVLLLPELPGKVEEPNFYFDLKEEKSALALELLMGTRGWRRFDWQQALAPPRSATRAGGMGMVGFGRGGGGVMPMKAGGVVVAGMAPVDALAEMPAMMPVAAPMPKPAEPIRMQAQEVRVAGNKRRAGPARRERRRHGRRARPMKRRIAAQLIARDAADGDMEEAPAMVDKEWARAGMAKMKAKPKPRAWAPVRVFPKPNHPVEYSGPRTDFRDTIHWEPSVRTDKNGKGMLTFQLSDAVTSFRVFAEGVGGGLIGRQERVITSKLPFSMNVKLPLEVSAGDVLRLPLTLTNEQDKALPVSITASFGKLLTLKDGAAPKIDSIPAGERASVYYPLEVTGVMGTSTVHFSADAGGLKDAFTRELKVVPLGFPQFKDISGTLTAKPAIHTFDIGDAKPEAVIAKLKVYASPLSTIVGGLEGLLREPGGCFEQTSSSNYPNIMVMQYLEANDVAAPALVARTRPMLDRGYRKLVSFETKQKGYEWFGSSPPHEALTAYGVLEFMDMKSVYGSVDDAMIERTVAFLKTRRDGKGGFKRNKKALDSFGRASAEVTDAYIMYAIATAGLAGEFKTEIAAQKTRSAETKDAYLLALAANTLLAIPGEEAAADASLKRLAAMQQADGAWTNASHSVTRSGGVNLHIETTALAMMALMQKGYPLKVRSAMEWLTKNRSGYGRWGATQATVLALKAMTQYSTLNRAAPSDGSITVVVNGTPVQTLNYKAGRTDPMGLEFGKYFRPGKNTVELRHKGEGSLPFSMAIEYRAENPATHPEAKVGVSTRLASNQVKMGESTRMTATVENRTAEPQPMTIARIGLPGGLTFQTWQLKELRETGKIAFYETRAREVILYFRDLKPSAKHEIPLDLVATVPGEFSGPASAAYLYYTDDQKFWAPGVSVRILN